MVTSPSFPSHVLLLSAKRSEQFDFYVSKTASDVLNVGCNVERILKRLWSIPYRARSLLSSIQVHTLLV